MTRVIAQAIEQTDLAAELIARAEEIASEVLAPAAEATDVADRVPDAHLEALADAGLLGIAGAVAEGGSDLDVEARRAVLRAVASGCGATAFVWAQHHGVVGLLRSAPEAPASIEWRSTLTSGAALAGTAFAHVRRSGPPTLTATPDGDRWRLEGSAPWATSWGMAEVLSVAATVPDGRILWAVLPAAELDRGAGGALVASVPQRLAVMGATATVGLTFDRLRVEPDEVVSVVDADRWRASDRRTAARANPSVLGVVDRALELVSASPSPGAGDAHESLAARLAEWERVDRELIGTEAPIDALARHRAAALDLAHRATTALLAVSGGAAMDLTHPGQRLAREAAFYVVQAQTADGREGTLASIA